MRNKLILDSAARHTPTAFRPGISLSEQLREERLRIEKSAIKSIPKTDKRAESYRPIKHPNLVATYHYIKQFMNPRRLSWVKIADLANKAGCRNARGQMWVAKKIGELANKCEEYL